MSELTPEQLQAYYKAKGLTSNQPVSPSKTSISSDALLAYNIAKGKISLSDSLKPAPVKTPVTQNTSTLIEQGLASPVAPKSISEALIQRDREASQKAISQGLASPVLPEIFNLPLGTQREILKSIQEANILNTIMEKGAKAESVVTNYEEQLTFIDDVMKRSIDSRDLTKYSELVPKAQQVYSDYTKAINDYNTIAKEYNDTKNKLVSEYEQEKKKTYTLSEIESQVKEHEKSLQNIDKELENIPDKSSKAYKDKVKIAATVFDNYSDLIKSYNSKLQSETITPTLESKIKGIFTQTPQPIENYTSFKNFKRTETPSNKYQGYSLNSFPELNSAVNKHNWEELGNVVKSGAQAIPAMVVRAGYTVASTPVELYNILAKKSSKPIPAPKWLQTLIGEKELKSYYITAKEFVESGMSPWAASVATSAFAAFDILLVKGLINSAADIVLTSKGTPEWLAWETLNKPKSLPEAKAAADRLKLEYKKEYKDNPSELERKTNSVNAAYVALENKGMPTRALKVPSSSHWAAWEILGRPETADTAEIATKNLIKEAGKKYKNNTPQLYTQIKTLNNANSIIKELGIPKEPLKITGFLTDLAQLSKTPVTKIISTLKEIEAEKGIYASERLKAELELLSKRLSNKTLLLKSPSKTEAILSSMESRFLPEGEALNLADTEARKIAMQRGYADFDPELVKNIFNDAFWIEKNKDKITSLIKSQEQLDKLIDSYKQIAEVLTTSTVGKVVPAVEFSENKSTGKQTGTPISSQESVEESRMRLDTANTAINMLEDIKATKTFPSIPEKESTPVSYTDIETAKSRIAAEKIKLFEEQQTKLSPEKLKANQEKWDSLTKLEQTLSPTSAKEYLMKQTPVDMANQELLSELEENRKYANSIANKLAKKNIPEAEQNQLINPKFINNSDIVHIVKYDLNGDITQDVAGKVISHSTDIQNGEYIIVLKTKGGKEAVVDIYENIPGEKAIIVKNETTPDFIYSKLPNNISENVTGEQAYRLIEELNATLSQPGFTIDSPGFKEAADTLINIINNRSSFEKPDKLIDSILSDQTKTNLNLYEMMKVASQKEVPVEDAKKISTEIFKARKNRIQRKGKVSTTKIEPSPMDSFADSIDKKVNELMELRKGKRSPFTLQSIIKPEDLLNEDVIKNELDILSSFPLEKGEFVELRGKLSEAIFNRNYGQAKEIATDMIRILRKANDGKLDPYVEEQLISPEYGLLDNLKEYSDPSLLNRFTDKIKQVSDELKLIFKGRRTQLVEYTQKADYPERTLWTKGQSDNDLWIPENYDKIKVLIKHKENASDLINKYTRLLSDPASSTTEKDIAANAIKMLEKMKIELPDILEFTKTATKTIEKPFRYRNPETLVGKLGQLIHQGLGSSGFGLLKNMGKAGNELLDSLNEVYTRYREFSGSLKVPAKNALEALSDEDAEVLHELLNNRRVPDNKLTPEVLKAAEVLNTNRKKLDNFAYKENINLKDPAIFKTKDGDIVNYLGEGKQLPEIIRYGKLKSDSKYRKAVLTAQVRLGHFKDVEEAQEFFNQYVAYIESSGDNNLLVDTLSKRTRLPDYTVKSILQKLVSVEPIFALSEESSRKLPSISIPLYDPNPKNWIDDMYDAISKRLWLIKEFGLKGEKAKDLLYEIGREGYDRSIANTIFQLETDSLPRNNSVLSRAMSSISQLAIIKLAFSPILQITQANNTLALSSYESMLKGIQDAFTKNGIEFHESIGGALSSSVYEAMSGYATHPFNERFTKGIGLTLMDDIQRRIASNIMKYELPRLLSEITKGNNIARNTRLVKDLLIKKERAAAAIKRGYPTEEEIRIAGSRFAEITQFSNRPGAVPVMWRDNEVVKMMMMFKSFSYQQGRFTKDYLLRHPLLLLKFLPTALLTTEAVMTLRSLINRQERPKWDEHPILRMTDDLISLSIFGILTDMYQQQKYGRSIIDWAAGPIFGELGGAATDLFGLNAKGLTKRGYGYLPLLFPSNIAPYIGLSTYALKGYVFPPATKDNKKKTSKSTKESSAFKPATK